MMKKIMTPAERVMTVLRGGVPDRTPFTTYENKLPRCSDERELRNRGLCLVKRTASYSLQYPDVKIKSYNYTDEQGRYVTNTVYSTPYGDLSRITQPAGFTSWTHTHEFKSEEDYKPLLFMIKNAVVVPNYEAAAKEMIDLGEDFVVRDTLPLEPLQNLISYYMGVETFCMEWMDNRDEIMKLYEAFVELARKIYPVVAEGPLAFANYGGNVIPNVIGLNTFKDFYIPHYNEAAEILHKKGKLLGCHFDADNTMIMDLIGQTRLDYIEAYDPGMSPPVQEAAAKWPDKVLWINWPSAWHLESLEKVYEGTTRILREAKGERLIIGITEDVPEHRWRENYRTIMDAIEDFHHV